jgi:predicted DNA-binding transcriptional regulator AlpA
MKRRKSEDWLDLVAVMNRLGLSRAGVYKAVASGRLKGHKVAIVKKVLRIDPRSVAEFEVSESHQRRGRRGARARFGI